jgi:hypothetical protein
LAESNRKFKYCIEGLEMQLDDIPRDNAHESLIFMMKMCIEEQKKKVSFSFHNLP